ncbi:unnamed protein product [Lactuca saligna]|uniref:ATP-dependent DNA helicase n=1 Tax=Lactuca saligna TaxID=75948 RepID=A0AA36E2Q0_LACSI|nr:unnamed protein product [Lactuca saligna]
MAIHNTLSRSHGIVKWSEITRYMDTHRQTDSHSRAYIIARVFNIKVHDFIRFLKEDKTFGGVETYLYTIEFHKRGLPHCHTLLWVSAADRVKIASDVDKYITAELPNPITEAELYETITTCMIHGPCGPLNNYDHFSVIYCFSVRLAIHFCCGTLHDTLRSAIPSKSMANFGLPVPSANLIGVLRNRKLLEEMSYDTKELLKQHNDQVPKLNNDQRLVYNKVVTSIENAKRILIFVYGHGGTSKKFLWVTILSYLRSIGKIILVVAASGIASLLLPSRKTAHSRFKIPIDLNNKKSCDIKKRTFLGDLMQCTTLIIWEEAPMSDRRWFEFFDHSLRDVLDCDEKQFGGMSVLLGGDFSETLPVLPKNTRFEIIALTLPSSYLWSYFIVHFLHTNMTLESSNTISHGSMTLSDFATWLLAIGNGHIGVPDKDDPRDSSWIRIPSSLLISLSPDSLQTLIYFVSGDDTLNEPTATLLSARAIVCPTNNSANEIKAHILKMVTSARVYNSTDTMQPNGKHTSDLEGLYPIEYLNQLSFPGIPPHELLLKVDCPIMLLRNISQREGLCNGTHMIVSQLLPCVIEATIITSTSIGKRVYIPRIKFIHNSSDLPFIFSRKQFPVKVCYSMTINKSQGQSLRKIGIYLLQPIYAHVQLQIQFKFLDSEQIRATLNLFSVF